MGWQDLVVFAVVAAALGFLVWKLWPRSRRPDVKASALVRKRDAPK
jgi:hypothetical protein